MPRYVFNLVGDRQIVVNGPNFEAAASEVARYAPGEAIQSWYPEADPATGATDATEADESEEDE